MNSIEKISENVAIKISKNISMDQDKKEVIAYGTFVLLQTIISIISIAVFGITFNVFAEIIIISTSAAILRKLSGGAHATAAINCILISMIIFGALSILVKNVIMKFNFVYLIVIIIIGFLFVFYIMYKYSPVGTTNKPLKNESTRKRLKRKSINFVISSLITNVILIVLYLYIKQAFLINIAICITVGVVWQSITLVSLGHKIIDLLDKALGGTIKIIRRTNE